jgi:hypothetical protein
LEKRWIRIFVWGILTSFFYLVIQGYCNGVILMGNPVSFSSRRQLFFWPSLAVVVVVWLYSSRYFWIGQSPAFLTEKLQNVRKMTPLAVRVIAACVFLLFPSYLFLFSPVGNYSLDYWTRLGTVLVFAYLAAVVLFTERSFYDWLLAWAGMVLITGAVFGASSWLNQVVNYPFSLSWSEGNRFWDYSLLFGKSRYLVAGDQQVFTFISIGRQFLWAVPFLIPGFTIAGMRFWDALTWILPPLLLGWAAVWHIPAGSRAWVWKAGLGLWVFVFLSQGPIYAPLIVSAILVVVAARNRHLLVGVVLVMLAGYYASISRFTWTYAPGLWAGLLALIDIDYPSFRREEWKKLVRPVVLGIAGYFGGQMLPTLIQRVSNGFHSGKSLSLMIDISPHISNQPLLWERWLPNPTYQPGILLGTLWAALPVLLLLGWLLWKRYWRPNRMQSASIVLVIGAFLAVGLVASVKIGGGSNLHNLDMFWITLALLVLWLLKELFNHHAGLVHSSKTFVLLLVLGMLLPITYDVQYGSPLVLPTQELVNTSLDRIQQLVGGATKAGEVLMMDQRQLLTFGYLKNVPLVDDYEKKYVMDQAMANNEPYFEGFVRDLKDHRFSMIVTEPVRISVKSGEENNFADENNSYVKWVSTPLLTYYKPLLSFDEIGVQLLVPRQ